MYKSAQTSYRDVKDEAKDDWEGDTSDKSSGADNFDKFYHADEGGSDTDTTGGETKEHEEIHNTTSTEDGAKTEEGDTKTEGGDTKTEAEGGDTKTEGEGATDTDASTSEGTTETCDESKGDKCDTTSNSSETTNSTETSGDSSSSEGDTPTTRLL